MKFAYDTLSDLPPGSVFPENKHRISDTMSTSFLFKNLAKGTTVLLVPACLLMGCTTTTPKKPQAQRNPVLSSKLPPPPPMRVTKETSSRRKPPLLPKTIVNIKDSGAPVADVSQAAPDMNSKTVESSAVPKYINNEQPQDFFQGVGDQPAGEQVFGSFFDSFFRPANPANQPVSSATYTTSP